MIKRLIFLSLISLVLSACGTAAINPSEPNSPTESGDVPAEATAQQVEMLKLVNQARQSRQTCGGQSYPAVAPLDLNMILSKTSQKHSEDMKATGIMSHTTQKGAMHYAEKSTPSDRVSKEGYDWRTVGENVAQGFSSAELVMQAWLESEGHCKNIMNPAFSELGVGQSGLYWTQVFAAPR